jgi:restriction system protein
MPVPDFQSMMRPLLEFAADGKEHELQEVTKHIADHFKLSDADREDMVPTGKQTRLANRVGWCRTHLKQAGAIIYVRRGVLQITDRGRELLAKNPGSVSLKILDQYPEHNDWFHGKAEKQLPVLVNPSKFDTPEEQIASLVVNLKQKLTAEILDALRHIDPIRFERVILDLLLAMGYGGSREEAANLTKQSHDEGIDGIINEDRLGLEIIYVQAKRWESTVGRKEIQSFVGALAGKKANKGIFITTSQFADTATEYAQNLAQKVILIDGIRLAELMIEHSVGVSIANTIQLKKIDTDYFEDV